ncbi:MAG: hypothetical protein JKY55_01010 [Aliivibrio sp.]|uniref:hypothetical protein n=1 Tax=Aliivibrio sp. TaxID=1872443 RepID=UPI001A4B6065|nr:hypothetical protein [Aliivibrio sp.]
MTLEWLTLAVIGGGAVVIWWSFRTWARGMNTRFDLLISEIKELSRSLVAQDGRLNSQEGRAETHEKRLNDHAKRLRDIELKQAKNTG